MIKSIQSKTQSNKNSGISYKDTEELDTIPDEQKYCLAEFIQNEIGTNNGENCPDFFLQIGTPNGLNEKTTQNSTFNTP